MICGYYREKIKQEVLFVKCTVNYEIDGERDFFVVEDRDAEKCRVMVNREAERLGICDEKNNISIDVNFDNRRSAWVFGIPCWYYADTEIIEGRNFFYEVLYITAMALFCFFSWVSRGITGRSVSFVFKVKGME